MSSFLFLISCIGFFLATAFDVHDKSTSNGMSDRTYYIGCIEAIWDYAPYNMNKIMVMNMMMMTLAPGMHAGKWIYGTNNNSVPWIGSKYYKAMYREYTDATFTMQVNRTVHNEGRDLHLGLAGPAIRAIVGERVRIVYKNMCSFVTTMHPHGVEYDKSSEGAPYNDGSMAGDAVAVNATYSYFWDFRSEMIDKFTTSKMWLYHSHSDETNDIHTGLFGPIIATQAGMETSTSDLRPTDIDYEFVAFFVVFDEMKSHLYTKTYEAFTNQPDQTSAAFIQSNLMHSINGFVYGNGEDFIMYKGNTVRWYVASFGNEGDGPHSPHWHGNIGVSKYESVDVVNLIPATTIAVDMVCDNIGKWLFHCHVNHHIHGGMLAFYDVLPSSSETTSVESSAIVVGFYSLMSITCYVLIVVGLF